MASSTTTSTTTITTCKAVVCFPTSSDTDAEPKAEVQTVALPQLGEGLLLVRVKAVALNPTDWKSIASGQSGGTRVGCDYAGVVEAVGPGVSSKDKNKNFRAGDRVCGMVFGGHVETPEMGAFGEYIVARADLQIRIPENLGFEEAATLGVGISTVGQGLYQTLQLPLPSNPSPEPIPILIYGGSTATGILAIQFAKASGFKVITTCSAHNFDYVKSLGADVVYDYRTEDLDALAHTIRTSYSTSSPSSGGPAAATAELTLAFDCSPTEASARFCAQAMSMSPATEKATYCAILRIDPDVLTTANPRVEPRFILAYTIFGHAFRRYGLEFPAKPEDHAFGVRFWEDVAKGALAAGTVKPARMAVNRGGDGLEGVVKGLEEMKQGKVSGMKLVYTV